MFLIISREKYTSCACIFPSCVKIKQYLKKKIYLNILYLQYCEISAESRAEFQINEGRLGQGCWHRMLQTDTGIVIQSNDTLLSITATFMLF